MLPTEGRRSNIQIVANILALLRLGEAGKTEVMYTVNMSHSQTEKYLKWLQELGLLCKVMKENRPASYRVTKKGLKLLSEIEHMQEMLRREEMPKILHAPELAKTVGKRPYNRIPGSLRNPTREH
jgi:predicted transcriptional regulator